VHGIAQDRSGEHVEFIKQAAGKIEEALNNIKKTEQSIEVKG